MLALWKCRKGRKIMSETAPAPSPTSMQIPAGEWNIFVNGVQLAKYTGPAELVFSVSFVSPLTEDEKAANKAGG